MSDTDRYSCTVDSPYGSTTAHIDLNVLRKSRKLTTFYFLFIIIFYNNLSYLAYYKKKIQVYMDI